MLLVNPVAGRGSYKMHIASILEAFYRSGWLPTVFFTSKKNEASYIVEQYAPYYDLLVCVGGDGTLSEVADGMMRIRHKKPVGYIPLGTANDVAHTLGLPENPETAALQITKGKYFPMDVGKFGPNQHFIYVSAFGAFTEVSYATPQENKKALGHLAYMLEGMRSLTKLSNYHAIIEYDGGVLEDDFIFGAVSNSTVIAGLVHLDSKEVNLSDGMFEVLLVKTPQNLLELNSALTSILSQNYDPANVLFLRSKEIRFTFEHPVAWTRDGEDGGEYQDATIVNVHPGIDLIV